MKLFDYRHAEGRTNFGDDLISWLWRQLIPDLWDDDASTVVLGAGTFLNSDIDGRVPIGSDKVVLERMGDVRKRLRADVRSGTVIPERGCDLQARDPRQARRASRVRIPLTVDPKYLGEAS